MFKKHHVTYARKLKEDEIDRNAFDWQTSECLGGWLAAYTTQQRPVSGTTSREPTLTEPAHYACYLIHSAMCLHCRQPPASRCHQLTAAPSAWEPCVGGAVGGWEMVGASDGGGVCCSVDNARHDPLSSCCSRTWCYKIWLCQFFQYWSLHTE